MKSISIKRLDGYKPEKILTIGYIATLLGIAFFSGLAVIVQNQYISIEEKSANAMVHIAKLQVHVQEIVFTTRSLRVPSSNAQREATHLTVLKLLNKVEMEHRYLLKEFNESNGFLWDLKDSPVMSPADREAYESLDSRIVNFVAEARKMVERSKETHYTAADLLRDSSIEILRILDNTQDLYSHGRNEKVKSYKNLQILEFALILCVIVLAGLFVFRPIANHVRATRLELERAKKASERANRIKTDFLTNISHEIRTPLGGIIGFTDMMLCDPECNGERRSHAQSIKRSAKHLKNLIDDLLDLSKVESGTMEFREIEFNLIDILHEVVSIVNVKVRDKNLDFKILFQSEVPDRIYSDPKRVTQILVNLLGNAAKFTDQGSIILRVAASKKGDKTNLIFSVTDTGCGIPSNRVNQLFKRFSQVDSSLSRKKEGTGLGLALSKFLAKKLSGDVSLVESTEGVGSTFRFSLTCNTHPHSKLISEYSTLRQDNDEELNPTEIAGLLLGVKILLVEDGPDNQKIFNYFLDIAGAKVHSCWDGLEGLEYGTKHEDIDLILMDIQLPKMDGYTVTGELRHRGVLKPIIALTAHAMQDERENCLKSGFTDYISKPVSIPHLIRTIKSHTTSPETPHLDQPSNHEPLRSKYHNQDIYTPMILEFAATLDERTTELHDCIRRCDWDSLRKAAHKIKGAASTYGYPTLTQQAAAIESLAASGAQSPPTEALMKKMEEFSETCQLVSAGARELNSKPS